MSDTDSLLCAPAGWRASRIRFVTDAARAVVALRAPELAPRTFVVLDAGAARAHPALREAAGPAAIELAGGERGKDFATLELLLRELVRRGVTRDARVVAIGGGAHCDLVGLAASLCLRGVELVLVPSTLLAMVDASVGGKTAIDLPEGKNLVGSFWPASEVLVDVGLAATQSEPEFRAGLAELAKVAIGIDAALFAACERDAAALLARDAAPLAAAVRAAVAAKLRIVTADPLERGERRLLNLGHTLGHALEARSGYAMPHGLAVAQGLHHVLGLAVELALLSSADGARCAALLDALGLPAGPLPPPAELLDFVARDKKLDAAGLTVVLPTAPGSSRLVKLSPRAFLRMA